MSAKIKNSSSVNINPESTLEALNEKINQLANEIAEIKKELPTDSVALVVFSGDMDKVIAAFTIANAAAAMGMKVTMFFTFWGIVALKQKTLYKNKKLDEKMISLMLPSSISTLPTSKLNMGGMGPLFFKHIMKTKNVQSLQESRDMAISLGIELIACEMSKDLLGIQNKELIEPITLAGAATFLAEAFKSKATLFI